MTSQTNNQSRREFLSSLAMTSGFLAFEPRAFASTSGSERPAGVKICAKPDLYKLQHLSDQAILETYVRVLIDACHYAEGDWRVSAFDPTVGFWGDGVSVGNEGIRALASMALACATLLKYEDVLSAAERREFLETTKSSLRYATATHLTGTQKCTDGKSWGATIQFRGESWQSGMWTGTLAWAAWLIWSSLDPALQQGLERVIAHEADILSHRQPPTGLWSDTKAEENGWEVPCLVLSELLFPIHPHAAAWHEAALEYMMNTLCTEADKRDTSLVDDRPVHEWVRGANLQPDFTLENHNRFHPSYVGCSCYFLTQAAMYYTYGGKAVPQAATHHLMDTWQMFRSITLPWGESAFPQGMDWELHGLPFINLFASLGTRDHDAFAAHMEQRSLQYMRTWQVWGKGSLAFPGSRFGITRHAINAEQMAYGLLAHKLFGPAVAEMSVHEATAQEVGTREHSYVGMVTHRTQKKFASFSWKNKIMGLLIPIGPGHEGNPNFMVPIEDGFVGSFELSPRVDTKVAVVEHSCRETPDGFEAEATLLLNDGQLKQMLRMTSVGNQTVVYEDRVIALADVTVVSERGVPIGIENDEISGGERVVSFDGGHSVFDFKKPQQPIKFSGIWANVDGRLGVVAVAGSGIAYAQASDYSPGIAVYADRLHGSYSNRTRQFKVGEEVARRIVVHFVEVTPGETATLALSCTIKQKPGASTLVFKQPEGTIAEIPLLPDYKQPVRVAQLSNVEKDEGKHDTELRSPIKL
ncbi:hypothetical protein [Edaphobacter bradus]|uniref:hypothetical protein n=1 Tax=Edaphobacter bradus TaxID=2259016 RepID=UPI0021E08106|nr:hypothetical protein [Edaphobacter bradus]